MKALLKTYIFSVTKQKCMLNADGYLFYRKYPNSIKLPLIKLNGLYLNLRTDKFA